MKVFFACLMLLLVSDCSMYYAADKECRKERVGYLMPFVGGFAAFIHCERASK